MLVNKPFIKKKNSRTYTIITVTNSKKELASH